MANTNDLIKVSEYDFRYWLDSTSRGFTPWGEHFRVEMVSEDEIIEIPYSGGQHFGSGGYRLYSEYSGIKPEFVGQLPTDRDSFTTTSRARFRMKSPSMLRFSHSDDLGNGKKHGVIYICASEPQIRAAKEAVRKEMKEKSANADPQVLEDYLLECWRNSAEWHKRYCKNGVCNTSDPTPLYVFVPKRVLAALEAGTGSERVDEVRRNLRYEEEVLLSFYRVLYHMKKEERISFFEKARAEYDSEVKASKVNFAKEQARILKDMGLSSNTAWGVIRTVGPSNAVESFEWIISIQKSHPRAFLYQNLTKIAKKSKKIYSWKLLNREFEKHNIQTPPGSYQQVLKNLRLAQELGFVHPEVKITN